MNEYGEMDYKDLIERQKQTGIPFSKLYMDFKRPTILKIQRKLPMLWNALMGKKYILPDKRQVDYYSAELCNHLILDFLMQIAVEGIPVPKDKEMDEVLNTQYASIIQQLDCGRPVFYLEKELAPAIMKTKLPDDFVIDDIQWRFPSFRVYLPKGCLSIVRNGVPCDMMYLDVVKIEHDVRYDLANKYKHELLQWAYGSNYIQMGVRYAPQRLVNKYNGMGVSGNLDFDSPESAIGYAGTTPFRETTIKKLFNKDNYTPLQAQYTCDELDNVFTNDMLKLAVNMLLFLASPVFLDEDDSKNVIRKPKMEGERLISGLYPAKFIGKMQLKIKDREYTRGEPTGKHVKGHWTSGHWQRIAYGPKSSLRRLQWIGLYWSGQGD